MSNSQYLGTNAGFYYFESGATTWKTFPLAVPLREPRSAYRVAQYAADSLDLSKREVLSVARTYSTGIFEYVAVLRYNDDQVGLIDFLKHAMLQSGSTDYPIRYSTALTTGTTGGVRGNGSDVWLIDYTLPFDTAMDRQRGSFGDLEATIRLRAFPSSESIAYQSFSTDSGARWF